MMFYLVTALYILVCLAMMLVVYLQQGKGGDIAAAFGGGSSQAAFGARSGATVLPGGIVLTGGGAMLRGFAEMCQTVTDLPVRVAAPSGTIGMDDELRGPHCATVVGLLRWGARTGRRSAVRSNNGANGHHGVSERFSRWLRELF